MRRKQNTAQPVFDLFEETDALQPDAPVDITETDAPEEGQVEVYDGRQLEDPEVYLAGPLPVVYDDRLMEEEDEGIPVALDAEPEPVPLPDPSPPRISKSEPVNPMPEFRGNRRSPTSYRRVFVLRDPTRVIALDRGLQGSLLELRLPMAMFGSRMDLIVIEKMKELHTKAGGIYPGDVFIFLASDYDHVYDHALHRPMWSQGVYVHCVTDEQADLDLLWSELVGLRCDPELLHIEVMYGGYGYEESLKSAQLLWYQLMPIYVPPKEDKKKK